MRRSALSLHEPSRSTILVKHLTRSTSGKFYKTAFLTPKLMNFVTTSWNYSTSTRNAIKTKYLVWSVMPTVVRPAFLSYSWAHPSLQHSDSHQTKNLQQSYDKQIHRIDLHWRGLYIYNGHRWLEYFDPGRLHCMRCKVPNGQIVY